jgi:hypothetical protein
VKKKLFAAVAVATVAGVVAVPGAAQAHDINVAGPFACGALYVQACGYGGPRDNHTSVIACDKVADGYGFVMRYRLRGGYEGTVNDPNGSKSGCGWIAVTTSNNPVVWVQPCSEQGALICWEDGMQA